MQIAVNIVLSACLIKEFRNTKQRERWLYISAFLPLLAFAGDVIGTWTGAWKGGEISQCVFAVLFAVTGYMIKK